MMPHLGEELWHSLGHETLLADEDWPKANAAYLVEDTVTVAVQVNGKRRGEVSLPMDIDQEAAQAAALEVANVKAAIGDKPIRKVIVVTNRIINVVV